MNVLVLIADELSWWALGHVSPHIKTPNIDRLAARSIRFTQAYTPSPICVPTRAAIATGRYVHEIGCWSSAEPYDGRVPGWGHVLQNAGLEPVSIGKLHFQSTEAPCGFSEQIEPVHVVDGVGWVQALLRRPVAPYDTTHTLARDIGPGETDYIKFDRRVTDAACRWLSTRDSTPWCAFVSWLAPHFPLVAPEEDYALYDPQSFVREAEILPDHPVLKQIADYFDHDQFFEPEARGVASAAYFALCTFLDRQMGRVLDTLDRRGLADNTLVLFTSDHGEMLGEKGFWTKSTMYDSAAKVPLLMAGPGIVPGRWDAPVSLIDLAPTICGTMGVPSGGFGGVDLRAPSPDRTVLSEYHDGGSTDGFTMVRWEHWKLVHYAGGHPSQLFNLRDDPDEVEDLASVRGDVVAEGMERLRAIMDPDEVNTRAHSDQAKRIAKLGGADAILNKPMFDYTPADSR